jgi:hypothetical protein
MPDGNDMTETASDWTADKVLITEVMNRYAALVASDDPSQVVYLFTEDAELHYGKFDVRGRSDIRRFFARTSPEVSSSMPLDTWVASTPVITNALIELDGNAASCESTCLAIHTGFRAGQGVVIVRGTQNSDRLTRTSIGWQINCRHHRTIWSFEVPGTPMEPHG